MLFFLNPRDCLIRADYLAHAAEGPSIQVPEPAVGTPLRTIEFGDDHPSQVGSLSGFEDPVGTDQGAEITSLAPAFIYLQSHGMVLCMLGELYVELFVCFPGYISKEIISVGIDPDDKRERVEFNDPDRLCHSEVFEKNAF